MQQAERKWRGLPHFWAQYHYSLILQLGNWQLVGSPLVTDSWGWTWHMLAPLLGTVTVTAVAVVAVVRVLPPLLISTIRSRFGGDSGAGDSGACRGGDSGALGRGSGDLNEEESSGSSLESGGSGDIVCCSENFGSVESVSLSTVGLFGDMLRRQIASLGCCSRSHSHHILKQRGCFMCITFSPPGNFLNFLPGCQQQQASYFEEHVEEFHCITSRTMDY